MNSESILNDIVGDVRDGQGICEVLKYYSIDDIELLIYNGAFNKDKHTQRRVALYLTYRIKDSIKIG